MPSDQPTPPTKPNYSAHLANERTFLAWIRTALALLAGAVAVVQLLPNLGIPGGRQILAAVLTVLSIGVVLGSAWRWLDNERMIDSNRPLHTNFMPTLLMVGIVGVGIIVMVLISVYEFKTYG